MLVINGVENFYDTFQRESEDFCFREIPPTNQGENEYKQISDDSSKFIFNTYIVINPLYFKCVYNEAYARKYSFVVHSSGFYFNYYLFIVPRFHC